MEERVARAMERCKAPPAFSDEEVAEQLRREALLRRERVKEHGVLAYGLPVVPSQNINKGFLLNTIKSVDSHNKRQEIDECWRKRELEHRVDDRSPSRHRSYRRSRSRSRERRRYSPSPKKESPKAKQDDERAFWAQRKAARTSAIIAELNDRACSIENAPNYDSESSSYEDIHAIKVDEEKESKKKKKEKKAKKHKKKKDKK
ncbi:hypothetical protein THRCLA_09433 [Thraustotheca clavata]|uniref:Uncharacterized protein n=1 Tax=Thraustotheca clavata TaxID=74557 RepID=A0A1V9YWC6_9STRA|nr:hypothetical protein THRCLA_09433 [Thraustotheca clavata]